MSEDISKKLPETAEEFDMAHASELAQAGLGMSDQEHTSLDETNTPDAGLPLAAGMMTVEATTDDSEGAPISKESLLGQLSATYAGYEALMAGLNGGEDTSKTPVATAERVAAEFEAWFSDDKVKAATALTELYPGTAFMLVATPNVLVTGDDIDRAGKALVDSVGASFSQSSKTLVSYSAEELSGTSPDDGAAVHFSLIPRATLTDDLSASYPYGEDTVEWVLSRLPEDTSGVKVPSVLDALAMSAVLLTNGEITDGFDFRSTTIDHIDLPPRPRGPYHEAPMSMVDCHNGALVHITDTSTVTTQYPRMAVA